MLASGVRPCVPVLTNSIGMQAGADPRRHVPHGFAAERGAAHQTTRSRTTCASRGRSTWASIPVTQAEFRAVMRQQPQRLRRAAQSGRGRRSRREPLPVEQVTWTAAVLLFAAVEACGREEGETDLPSADGGGVGVRLPRRGSPDCPFHFGKTLQRPQANFESEYPYPPNSRRAEVASLNRPCEVGRYRPERLRAVRHARQRR